MSDITRILNSIEQGDPRAADELLPLIYAELRRMAAQKMAKEANAAAAKAKLDADSEEIGRKKETDVPFPCSLSTDRQPP